MILSSKERIEEYTGKGWWGTTTLEDCFQRNVAAFPDKIAVIDPLNYEEICQREPRQLSYRQLNEEVDRLAALLVGHGLGKDDIIAVQLPNGIELMTAYLAIMRIGAITTPFPVQYREYELSYLLEFVEAKAILTMTEIRKRHHVQVIQQLRPRLNNLEYVFAWGRDLPEDVVSIDEAWYKPIDEASYQAHLSQVSITANDIFTICWTSGTEGTPKGVPRSHNEWFISAYGQIDLAEVSENDTVLNPFPAVNMAGLAGTFIPWLMTGCTLVQHHPFELSVFLQQIERFKATYTFAAPAILNQLLREEKLLETVDLSSLRMIGSGSAPLSPWMVRTWYERFGIHVLNSFGSNEGISFTSSPREIADFDKRALYFPRYGVAGFEWHSRSAKRIQTRLVDLETGEEITEPKRPGELRIKGASVFAGYWKANDLTAKSFDEEGYFCTGDVLEIAGEGEDYKYYRMVGRSKDIVIRGGMNISPLELEGVLQSHPLVKEVAIIGYPDEILGEKVCACVVSHDEATITLEDLNAFLKEKRMASYKLPERLMILEQLPRNPVGKVEKYLLREQLNKVTT